MNCFAIVNIIIFYRCARLVHFKDKKITENYHIQVVIFFKTRLETETIYIPGYYTETQLLLVFYFCHGFKVRLTHELWTIHILLSRVEATPPGMPLYDSSSTNEKPYSKFQSRDKRSPSALTLYAL
jgi:hypothetical protein